MTELNDYALDVCRNARLASTQLTTITGTQKQKWLNHCAKLLIQNTDLLIAENQKDLQAGAEKGLSSAMLDRLMLNAERIEGLANAVKEIGTLPEPVGEVIESSRRPNGILVTKVRVPLGVVFFIYESRPNVTMDAAALCVKSGNAVILRGGSEAFHSNTAIHKLITKALLAEELPEHAVQLVQTTDRAAVGEFLAMGDQIDVTIPRGGRSLIERVTKEATMPVIKHFDGICHVYIDQYADPEMAIEITVNSKCHRPGVCNAAETLLIHEQAAAEIWPKLAAKLLASGVQLRCCPRSIEGITGAKPATDLDFHTEYVDLILSVKIVDDIQEAIGHIREYGSGHTESIVTNSLSASRVFQNEVDSAAVMINVSTRFNDGGEFGLGAEIGISTDRFHARGPCGLKEIMSYKYVVHGDGQIR
ncbi:MAG: glutamate-5-semialdehyde dehydrogenase [Fuerstiella sp.]